MKIDSTTGSGFFRVLALLLTFAYCQISSATICPDVGTIISGSPDSTGTKAFYLSPGWSSNEVPIINLADTTFSRIYADAGGMECIYDTNRGYLTLYPNNNQLIDTSTLVNEPYWHCDIEQGPYNATETETVCTCGESLEKCSFRLQ